MDLGLVDRLAPLRPDFGSPGGLPDIKPTDVVIQAQILSRKRLRSPMGRYGRLCLYCIAQTRAF
ncbi:hypothetical protein Cmtc_09680 [Cupriavidus sp. TKC]|nr:hypothetical protein Cmtc_09680 [Cupriavidus sp. TKC]